MAWCYMKCNIDNVYSVEFSETISENSSEDFFRYKFECFSRPSLYHAKDDKIQLAKTSFIGTIFGATG